MPSGERASPASHGLDPPPPPHNYQKGAGHTEFPLPIPSAAAEFIAAFVADCAAALGPSATATILNPQAFDGAFQPNAPRVTRFRGASARAQRCHMLSPA